jgi:cation diffusion facilitator CzcD-associated flavoprotein CzcO
MKHANVIVVGGGQAGLSISYCLSRQHVDHVSFLRKEELVKSGALKMG